MSPVSLLSPLSNPVLGFSTNLNSQMQAFSPKELTTYKNSTTHEQSYQTYEMQQDLDRLQEASYPASPTE